MTDKIIADFLKESQQSNHRIDMKNLDAYRSMPLRHEQNDIAKTLPKTKDFEHEL